ncbi:MAG: hypothetical protein JXL67_05035 [Calditrichaeota bacterium]|nr:hypothetical protein [Calditrichota bacterium]
MALINLKRHQSRYRYAYYTNQEKILHVLETGPGPGINRETLLKNIELIKPSLIINYGICGTLDPAIQIHRNYFIRLVREAASGKELLLPKPAWLKNHIYPEKKLLTVQKPVFSSVARTQLHKESGCTLVDMEGFTVASIAIDLSVPVILLKLVTDRADEKSGELVKLNVKIWQEKLNQMLHQLFHSMIS